MLRTTNRYKTRQRAELLDYMSSCPGRHLTAREIAEHFHSQGQSMGVATIYRHLEQLLQDGVVKKYLLDGMSAACFEYVGDRRCAEEHCFHFKCEKCGQLIHFHCRELEQAQSHMLHDHGFDINSVRTVFYGTCDRCSALAERK